MSILNTFELTNFLLKHTNIDRTTIVVKMTNFVQNKFRNDLLITRSIYGTQTFNRGLTFRDSGITYNYDALSNRWHSFRGRDYIGFSNYHSYIVNGLDSVPYAPVRPLCYTIRSFKKTHRFLNHLHRGDVKQYRTRYTSLQNYTPKPQPRFEDFDYPVKSPGAKADTFLDEYFLNPYAFWGPRVFPQPRVDTFKRTRRVLFKALKEARVGQATMFPAALVTLLTNTIDERISPLLGVVRDKTSRQLFINILVSNLIHMFCHWQSMKDKSGAKKWPSVLGIATSLISIFMCYITVTGQDKELTKIKERVQSAVLEAMEEIFENHHSFFTGDYYTVRAGEATSNSANITSAVTGICALLFVVVMGVTTMARPANRDLTASLNQFHSAVNVSRDIKAVKGMVEDMILPWTQKASTNYVTRVKAHADRAAHILQKPIYWVIQNPRDVEFCKTYSEELTRLVSSVESKELNKEQSALHIMANQHASDMIKYARAANIALEKKYRPECKGFWFVGPPNAGKTILCRELLHKDISAKLGYRDDGLYFMDNSESAKYYAGMAGENAAYVDDMARNGAKCKITQEVHTLLSASTKTLQTANLEGKEQTVQFKYLMASSNQAPASIFRNLPFIDPTTSNAYMERFRWIVVERPNATSRQTGTTQDWKTAPPAGTVYDKEAYTFQTLEWNPHIQQAVSTGTPTYCELVNMMANAAAATEVEYLRKILADQDYCDRMAQAGFPVFKQDVQSRIDVLVALDFGTGQGVTGIPQHKQNLLGPKCPQAYIYQPSWSAPQLSDPSLSSSRRRGQATMNIRRNIVTIRLQGAPGTGKTVFATTELGPILKTLTHMPIDTSLMDYNDGDIPTDPRIYILDDALLRDRYSRYLTLHSRISDRSIVVICTNDVISPSGLWSKIRNFTTKPVTYLDVPCELDGISRRIGIPGVVITSTSKVDNGDSAQMTYNFGGPCKYDYWGNPIDDIAITREVLRGLQVSWFSTNTYTFVQDATPPMDTSYDIDIIADTLDELRDVLSSSTKLMVCFRTKYCGVRITPSWRVIGQYASGLNIDDFRINAPSIQTMIANTPKLMNAFRKRVSNASVRIVVNNLPIKTIFSCVGDFIYISPDIPTGAADIREIVVAGAPTMYRCTIGGSTPTFSADYTSNTIAAVMKGDYTMVGLDEATNITYCCVHAIQPASLSVVLNPPDEDHRSFLERWKFVLVPLVIIIGGLLLFTTVKLLYTTLSKMWSRTGTATGYVNSFAGKGRFLTKEEYDERRALLDMNVRYESGDMSAKEEFDFFQSGKAKRANEYRSVSRVPRTADYDDDIDIGRYGGATSNSTFDSTVDYTDKMMRVLDNAIVRLYTPAGGFCIFGMVIKHNYILTVNHPSYFHSHLLLDNNWVCKKINFDIDADLALYEITPKGNNGCYYTHKPSLYPYLVAKNNPYTDYKPSVKTMSFAGPFLVIHSGSTKPSIDTSYVAIDDDKKVKISVKPSLQTRIMPHYTPTATSDEWCATFREGQCGLPVISELRERNTLPKVTALLCARFPNQREILSANISRETFDRLLGRAGTASSKTSVTKPECPVVPYNHATLHTGVNIRHAHRCPHKGCSNYIVHTHTIGDPHHEEFFQCKHCDASMRIEASKSTILRRCKSSPSWVEYDQHADLMTLGIHKQASVTSYVEPLDPDTEIICLGHIVGTKQGAPERGYIIPPVGERRFEWSAMSLDEVTDKTTFLHTDTKGNVSSIGYTQFRKCGMSSYPWNPDRQSWNISSKIYRDWLVLEFPQPRMLSLREVINGETLPKSNLYGVLTGIDMTKAIGFLFNRIFSLNKKKDIFSQVTHPSNPNANIYVISETPAGDYLKFRIKARLHLAMENKGLIGFNKCCLKDELLPVEKVAIGKTRQFYIGDMDMVIFQGIFLGWFHAMAKLNNAESHIKLGLNLVANGNTMYRAFHFNGPVDADDISGLDKDYHRLMFKEVHDALSKLSWDLRVPKDLQEEFKLPSRMTQEQMSACLFQAIMSDVDAFHILDDGSIWVKPNALGSGCLATTLMGCLGLIRAEAYSITAATKFRINPHSLGQTGKRIMEACGVPSLDMISSVPELEWDNMSTDFPTGWEFKYHYNFPTYGDDHVRNSLKFPYHPIIRREIFKDVCWKLVPIDKNGEGLEIPFLGCEPLWSQELGVYFMALRKSAIEKIYTCPKVLDEDAIGEHFTIALEHAATWGIDYYNHVKTAILGNMKYIPIDTRRLRDYVINHDYHMAVNLHYCVIAGIAPPAGDRDISERTLIAESAYRKEQTLKLLKPSQNPKIKLWSQVRTGTATMCDVRTYTANTLPRVSEELNYLARQSVADGLELWIVLERDGVAGNYRVTQCKTPLLDHIIVPGPEHRSVNGALEGFASEATFSNVTAPWITTLTSVPPSELPYRGEFGLLCTSYAYTHCPGAVFICERHDKGLDNNLQFKHRISIVHPVNGIQAATSDSFSHFKDACRSSYEAFYRQYIYETLDVPRLRTEFYRFVNSVAAEVATWVIPYIEIKFGGPNRGSVEKLGVLVAPRTFEVSLIGSDPLLRGEWRGDRYRMRRVDFLAVQRQGTATMLGLENEPTLEQVPLPLRPSVRSISDSFGYNMYLPKRTEFTDAILNYMFVHCKHVFVDTDTYYLDGQPQRYKVEYVIVPEPNVRVSGASYMYETLDEAHHHAQKEFLKSLSEKYDRNGQATMMQQQEQTSAPAVAPNVGAAQASSGFEGAVGQPVMPIAAAAAPPIAALNAPGPEMPHTVSNISSQAQTAILLMGAQPPTIPGANVDTSTILDCATRPLESSSGFILSTTPRNTIFTLLPYDVLTVPNDYAKLLIGIHKHYQGSITVVVEFDTAPMVQGTIQFLWVRDISKYAVGQILTTRQLAFMQHVAYETQAVSGHASYMFSLTDARTKYFFRGLEDGTDGLVHKPSFKSEPVPGVIGLVYHDLQNQFTSEGSAPLAINYKIRTSMGADFGLFTPADEPVISRAVDAIYSGSGSTALTGRTLDEIAGMEVFLSIDGQGEHFKDGSICPWPLKPDYTTLRARTNFASPLPITINDPDTTRGNLFLGNDGIADGYADTGRPTIDAWVLDNPAGVDANPIIWPDTFHLQAKLTASLMVCSGSYHQYGQVYTGAYWGPNKQGTMGTPTINAFIGTYTGTGYPLPLPRGEYSACIGNYPRFTVPENQRLAKTLETNKVVMDAFKNQLPAGGDIEIKLATTQGVLIAVLRLSEYGGFRCNFTGDMYATCKYTGSEIVVLEVKEVDPITFIEATPTINFASRISSGLKEEYLETGVPEQVPKLKVYTYSEEIQKRARMLRIGQATGASMGVMAAGGLMSGIGGALQQSAEHKFQQGMQSANFDFQRGMQDSNFDFQKQMQSGQFGHDMDMSKLNFQNMFSLNTQKFGFDKELQGANLAAQAAMNQKQLDNQTALQAARLGISSATKYTTQQSGFNQQGPYTTTTQSIGSSGQPLAQWTGNNNGSSTA